MALRTRRPLRSLLLLACAAGLSTSCANDREFVVLEAKVTTVPLVDAGLVAVGDRETVNIRIQSEGQARATIDAITLENEGDSEAFVLMTWYDETGTLTIDPGTATVPSAEVVEVSFRPEAAGYYRALMTIHSNDKSVADGNWKVALRGMAQYPCGSMAPITVDYGKRPAGGYFPGYVNVSNCGQVTLTIAGFEVEGSSSFYVSTPDPVYVIPGGQKQVEIGWIPASSTSASATVSFVTNDPDMEGQVRVFGNNCAYSVSDTWDADADGWFECGGDCDDADPLVSPSDTERQNGYDDDCDGTIDEAANSTTKDNDGDAFTEDQGDCDDADAAIYPGAPEAINQVDDDCNGIVDDTTTYYDDDSDGFSERTGDCDDGDPLVFPGADETVDGADNDCDGNLDEGGLEYDDDGDGFSESAGDCADGDPWSFPGGAEDCDSVDNDCDDQIDEDEACAYLAATDEDEDPAVTDSAARTPVSASAPGGCAAVLPATPLLFLFPIPALLARRRRSRRS